MATLADLVVRSLTDEIPLGHTWLKRQIQKAGGKPQIIKHTEPEGLTKFKFDDDSEIRVQILEGEVSLKSENLERGFVGRIKDKV